MKNLHSFLTAFLLIVCTSLVAQNQWDIEGTILNEYDLVTGIDVSNCILGILFRGEFF